MKDLTAQEIIEKCEGTACFECNQQTTCSVYKALYVDYNYRQPKEVGIKTDDPIKLIADKYYNGKTKPE